MEINKLTRFIGLDLTGIQSRDDSFVLTFENGDTLTFCAEPVGACNSRAYVVLDDGTEIIAD